MVNVLCYSVIDLFAGVRRQTAVMSYVYTITMLVLLLVTVDILSGMG